MIKFYKTIVRVEILHEGGYEFDDLKDLHNDITHGDCSGNIVEESVEALTKEELAFECGRHGTNLEFFLGGEEEVE